VARIDSQRIRSYRYILPRGFPGANIATTIYQLNSMSDGIMIDLEQLRSVILSGDEECIDIFKDFCVQIEELFLELRLAVESEDRNLVQRLCHKMRGSCATMGFVGLMPALGDGDDGALMQDSDSVGCWIASALGKFSRCKELACRELGIE